MFKNINLLDEDYLEKLIRKVLPYYLLLVLLFTLSCSLYAYLIHNRWVMVSWLINYQGGFIKRGFFGEVIYQLSKISGINPGVFIVFSHLFFYGIFFYFSYSLLKEEKYLLPYTFLIFSPFIFTFQVNFPRSGCRKEIIYFALLSFFVWYVRENKKNLKKAFYLILLIYPAMILTHEMFAILLPYFFAAYFTRIKINKREVVKLFLLLLPSFIVSIVVIFFRKATFSQIKAIIDSLSKENYSIVYLKHSGALFWMGKGIKYGLKRVHQGITQENYIFKYFSVLLLSIIAYIPIFGKIKSFLKNKVSLFFGIIPIIGSIPVFIMAIDWGRFIYFHLVSIFLLSFLGLEYKYKKGFNDFSKIKKISLIVFFILYTQLWHIPVCCMQRFYPKNIYEINIFAFFKPKLLQKMVLKLL